jgi:TonB family protein
MRRTLSILSLLLLSACSAAVATGGDRSALLLSDRPAPRASCHILYQPQPLPSLSQLADSAALVRDLADFAQRHPLRDGSSRALYSVSYTADGRIERLHALDYWLPQGQADAFTSLVRRHLRPQLSTGGSIRILLQPVGDEPVRIGRSERCPPESRTTFRLRAPALAQQQRPQPVRVRMHVDAQGRVLATDLLSSSGNAELDRWVRQTLQRYQFAPGLIDGTAVEMAHEETVRIAARP